MQLEKAGFQQKIGFFCRNTTRAKRTIQKFFAIQGGSRSECLACPFFVAKPNPAQLKVDVLLFIRLSFLD